MKPLIAIVGNTGVGKSQFAVELAKAINGEIINCDAMQMYQGLDIITNKHPVIERENIPHHLLGFEPWHSQLTVQDFEKKATSLISRIHESGKLPILVGGTHYYIQSLIAQNSLIAAEKRDGDGSAISDISSNENETRNIPKKHLNSEQLSMLENPQAVEETLRAVDPVILAKFHPNDTRRLRRALEIWFETGERPSEIYEKQKSGSESEKLKLRYRVLTFWVWCNREVLADRLDRRVDSMIEQGLLEEIQSMHEQYDPAQSQTGIWQVLGFRQFRPWLETRTPEALLASKAAMQSETRQYAKKQTKWIRNKLAPLIESLGGQFAMIDSSDLAQWKEQSSRGVTVAQQWLNDTIPQIPLIPEGLENEIVRRRPAFDKTQWVRYVCEVCSTVRGSEVVFVGDEEWQVHLKSKGHRAALKKLAKLKDSSV